MNRSAQLKEKYNLEKHPEGGWFSEVYTAPFDHEGRPLMGSIYFLLEGDDISHFHQIDCDEIWYHHEGTALKITMIMDGAVKETVIGPEDGQEAMAVIPKGAIFAAENLDKHGYCFMSCATTPQFTYEGFRLVYEDEIRNLCPDNFDKIAHLAFTNTKSGNNADMNEITLISAIKENDLKTIEHILVQDPALVTKEALFCATREGHMDILKYLVEYSRVSLNEYDDKHRNVLHYGAESGNLEIFRYLVDKCGMDPLVGDKNLVTPWDIVHNQHLGGSSEIERYLEARYGHKYEDFYRNPIRTGFFPDPSICRVGEDYYMVNSSFIFFPCIPVSHSRDLVHWEIIGHAITNPEWAHLDELEGGRGYWAPDISFYKGRFYITATYRLNDIPPTYRRQIVVSSDKPEGPYSEPVFIDEDGIDPSIFNDDDGKRYMLLNRGARIFELDESGTKKISDAQLLFYGDHKRAPEGPHLYKKDGYYYLLEAEGGTGPGHRVTVSRAKKLFGNYEPCPYNPIMRQNDPDAGIQRCGHGDLVETQDGRWYMVYLCGRMIGDGYSLLGRETAIDPVTWTPDGWPIVNGLKGPSTMQVKPFADANTTPEQTGISPCGLPFDYMTPRPFTPGGVLFSPETGRFEISGSKAPLSSVDSRNIVLKRQTSFEFQYAATLEIPAMTEGQTAGITGYYDENTFFEFGITSRGGQIYLYSNEHVGDEDRTKISDEPVPAGVSSIRLIMDTSYLTRKLFYQYLPENGSETEFITLDNVCYLCDEGLKKGKRFTGAMVGMYAYAGDNDLKAVFFLK